MEFRRDINGLRAWAVVLVVLYHFGVPGFSGGFVGVDIFFVISGFLMTGIILTRQASSRFSLSGFYLSRARRIVPALAALLLSLLIFGYSWLGPLDYRELSKHVLAAISFISNFVFRNESGYFDTISHEKWLLHTWSLSTEWQFYLLFPLLLMGIRRLCPEHVGWVMAIALLASLGWSVWQTQLDPSTAFFLLPARAWEMLAGGLVYLYGGRLGHTIWSDRLLEVIGLGLILLAGMVLANQAHWPGAMAIVPVAGAALLMLASRQSSWLTAAPPIQALGQWSYSIYLWHWPFVVGAQYFAMTWGPLLQGLLVLASVVMGYLSFRFVEEPVRHRALGLRIQGKAMWSGVLVLMLPAMLIYHFRGIPSRWSEELVQLEAETVNRKSVLPSCGWNEDGSQFHECHFGTPGKLPSVALWGDSHALATIRSIGEAAGRQSRSVLLLNNNGCPPLPGARLVDPSGKRDCQAINDEFRLRLVNDANIDTVIFLARWSSYLEGRNESTDNHPYVKFGPHATTSLDERRVEYAEHMVQSLCTLAAVKRVAVVAPLPEFGVHVPRAMVRNMIVHGHAEPPKVSMAEYLKRNKTVLAALEQANRRCGVTILDPRAMLCDSGFCYGARSGHPLYFDDDHPGAYGNRALEPMFDAFFSSLGPVRGE